LPAGVRFDFRPADGGFGGDTAQLSVVFEMIQDTMPVKTGIVPAVRLKAVLQSRGVRIPAGFVDALERNYNAPAVRTGRLVLCLESPAGNGETTPVFIVNGRRSAASPFELVRGDSGFEVRSEGNRVSGVTILPRPAFYGLRTVSGVPRHKLAVIVGPGHLRAVVSQRCRYQQAGRGCRFCAVQRWWDAGIEKAAADIAETVAMAVREGAARHVSLTTATLDTPGKGLESLVETARLIRERVAVPIMLEFEPIEDFTLLECLLLEAREAGVTTVSCNIECFDERLRTAAMPAKGLIPVETYRKTWQKCLDIFGWGQVFTVAIAGIGETDDSLLAGIDMAAAAGVMTFLVPHSPALGAAFEDMEAPDAARMLSLYEKAAAIYRRHSLDLNASKAGCVRGGGFSAIKDIYNFGV
jgi:radical SAM protein (TIGR04043 family)